MHTVKRGKKCCDGYLGSGQLLQKAIKKYGRQHFLNRIVRFCKTVDEAKEYEEYYINKYNSLQPNGYNIHPKGGKNIQEWRSEQAIDNIKEGVKNAMTPERKAHLREINLGKKHSEATKRKIRRANKGKKRSPEACKNIANGKKGAKHPMYGKTHTPEARRKISEGNKGKKHTSEAKEKCRVSKMGDKNPMFGKPISDYVKQRVVETHKGRKITDSTRNKMRETQLKIIEENKGNGSKVLTKRKVCQYTMEGDLIKEWESISVAAKETGIDRRFISRNANGGGYSAKGFRWSFKKQDKL
jgi:group I intron endonuclease